MKVVSCKSCGAKYQLDDEDTIKNYECSACAGDLEFLESYPSNSSKKIVLFPKNDSNDHDLVYCTKCGLKHKLDYDEDINDFECSSCYGDLKYVDDEVEQESTYIRDQIDENTVESELSASPQDKEEIEVKTDVSADEIDVTNTVASRTQNESKLRESLKEESLDNVDNEYAKYTEDETPVANESKYENDSKKIISEDKDKVTERSVAKDKPFETKKTTDKNKLNKKKSKNKGKKEKIATKDKSTKNSKKSSDSHKKSKTHERELVSNPKIKSKNYHHGAFMEMGIIIALVGLIDIFLTDGRLFSIAFVVIGIIVLVIGVILRTIQKNYNEMEKLVREKLLTLPKDFYVLSYVKLPNADSEINHVVIGPTGIFTILTQKYKTKKSKKKPSLAIASFSLSKKVDINANRKAILNFDEKDRNKFDDNTEEKQKSIQLSKNLIEYLGENGLNKFYIEPLICFINKKVSIINIVLTDEDLFLEELLTKISNENVKLDYTTINKCAALLAEYSAESS